MAPERQSGRFLAALLGAIAMLAAVSMPASPAQADAVVVSSAGATRTIACNDNDAQVFGSRNVITFSGRCAGLQIRGDSNTISIALTGRAPIDIEGSRNRVRYTTAPDAQPTLRVVGSFTEVMPARGATMPRAETAVLQGDYLNIELDCGGGLFTLQTIRSTLWLRNGCSALTVRGEANVVHADLAPEAQVLIEGNAITLLTTQSQPGLAPQIKVVGMGSIVAPESSLVASLASPAAPGQPPLANVPLVMLIQVLDAQVTPAGTLIRLPSVAFDTDALSPGGELQLQRVAALMAQISPSGVRIIGHEANSARARQRANLVSDYLLNHGFPGMTPEILTDTGDGSVNILLLK